MTLYTAKEIATLQSRLDKQLGPEYISTRPGNGGGKVHYLAAEKVINLANEVFGFNGWSSAIQNVQIDFVDENPTTGRINLGLSTIVRVTLRDGTYHEDIGYGHCENTKGKAAAFEKAKKEAATDAMKRALRNFGNVLGNCLYDKDYLQRITKVKVAPSKWDADNLHRHPDYAPAVKRAATTAAVTSTGQTSASKETVQRNTSVRSNPSNASEFEDEFGGNIFDDTEYEHPDEVRLEEPRATDQNIPPQTTSAAPRTNQKQDPLPQPGPSHAMQTAESSATTMSHQAPGRAQQPHTPGRQPNRSPSKLPPQAVPGAASAPRVETSLPPSLEGFVAARQADLLNQPSATRPPNTALAFNPHAESPSIRRTQGVNPGKSVPISRHQIRASQSGSGPAPAPMAGPNGPVRSVGPNTTSLSAGSSNANGPVAPNVVSPPVGPNIINPSADAHRRIGMPPPVGAPQTRGGYRPPSAVKRPAMAEITNLQQVDGAGEVKRTKTAEAESAPDHEMSPVS